ncbi:UPF0764 protein C16orf89 homolog isoform X1 [Amblyomma americanum]
MATVGSGPALRRAVLVTALLSQSCMAASVSSLPEIRPLGARILSALEGAVDALATNMDSIYLDAALGLRVADDRLQELISQASDNDDTGAYRLSSGLGATVGDLRVLQQKTELLADTATRHVLGTKQGCAHETLAHGLLRKGLWKYAAAGDRRMPVDEEPELTAPDLVERASDDCIQQLFSAGHCADLNNTCWVAMTGGRQHGYALTHQAIFLTIGIRLNCTAKLNSLAVLHAQPPVGRNLASKCAQVADDAQLILDENFPLRLRDLFMEQGVVCGFMDLPVFKDASAMEAVLSWQRDDGCYVAEHDEPATNSNPKKVKREERKGKDGCSLHMTSVAAGALATYLHILYRAQHGPKMP